MRTKPITLEQLQSITPPDLNADRLGSGDSFNGEKDGWIRLGCMETGIHWDRETAREAFDIVVALNAVRAAMCQDSVSLAIKLRCHPDGTRLWEAIKAAGGIKNVEVGFTLPPRGKGKPLFGRDRGSLGHLAMGLVLFNLVFDAMLVNATLLPSGEIGVKIRAGVIGSPPWPSVVMRRAGKAQLPSLTSPCPCE